MLPADYIYDNREVGGNGYTVASTGVTYSQWSTAQVAAAEHHNVSVWDIEWRPETNQRRRVYRWAGRIIR